MVTILERPEGRILSTTAKTATVNESYGAGDAQFVVPTVHGLTDGDYIYTESNIEDYAGFFYVDVISTGIFKLRRYPTSEDVQFIANGSITYYESILTHGWSAVHLPITYRLSNNLYPTNSSDTARNVSSVTNLQGLTVLNLSGSLGTINTYDFVYVTLPNDTELSGVYQIVEWISATVVLINLAYDSGNNFTSATAQKYYNNYNFLVRVYAGINASHEWASVKPYELAATLKIIPDSDNQAFFSINEILKGYVETRNNLTLGTLPNNTDFWTNFYIEVAESYDDSDGYSFGTNTSSFTSDQSTFEGTAVNAQLAFKNQYSGYMSEYLMTNNTAKFLTLFSIPVLFQCSDDTPNCYQDISFLNPYDNIQLSIKKEFYLNQTLGTTVVTSLGEQDSGVIRAELEADCSYDRVDITVVNQADVGNLFADGSQPASGGVSWVSGTGGASEVTLNAGQQSRKIGFEFDFIAGVTYDITQLISISGGGTGQQNVFVQIYESFSGSFTNEVASTSYLFTSPNSFELTPTENGSYIVITIIRTGGSGTLVYTLEGSSVSGDISETKQFRIDCGCSQQDLHITWLNNLPGFDNWKFTAKKDHIVEIQEALTTVNNTFPNWPNSYGSQADTIRKQVSRISNKAFTVRSQYLTQAEADAIGFIKSSVLVQIVNSRTDRRTVIVDTDSFVKYKDLDDLYSITFNISFTDNIPVQTV